MMLNTEVLWTKALTDNNVRGIIHWLRTFSVEGDGGMETSLTRFRSWLQGTAEMTKKELLTLCFGCCQGLWMFLDQTSFTRVHVLIQRLRNLLSLIHYVMKQNGPLHLCNGTGHSCGVREVDGQPSITGWSGWTQELQSLRQHMFLGRLVQWWGITGLLPKNPDAHRLKQISQMWREMDKIHKQVCLELRCDAEEKHRWSSLIQGMVAHLDKQHGPVWVSEDCSNQTYPPPCLQALLKLVLIPHIDIISVQAILMYFILDVSNFLKCRDNLLQSFCHAFNIPANFSQQIRGFWLLDHGFVLDSIEVLLSPKSKAPWLPWQHRAILRTLLKRGEGGAALRYLYCTAPAIENTQDIRLRMDILLQNNCVSEAWTLLRTAQTGDDQLCRLFMHGCESLGLHDEDLALICQDMPKLCLTERQRGLSRQAESSNNGTQGEKLTEQQTAVKDQGQPLRPLSSWLYQALNSGALSSDNLIKLLRESVSELQQPQKTVQREEVVWPEHMETRVRSMEIPLSSQGLYQVLPKFSAANLIAEPQQHQSEDDVSEDDLPLLLEEMDEPLSVFSSRSTSPDSPDSVCSFASAPSFCCPDLTEVLPSSGCGSTEPLTDPSDPPRDGDSQNMPDGEKNFSDATIFCCPVLTLTLEGSSEAVSFNSLDREGEGDKPATPAEFGVEEILTCIIPGNISLVCEDNAVEITQTEKRQRSRLNLHPQCYSNEDNQSVPSTSEGLLESHNFLTPESEKIVYKKGVSDDIVLNSESVNAEWNFEFPGEKAENIDPQAGACSEAQPSHSFLELQPLRRAMSLPQIEEQLEVFRRDSQDVVDQPEILTSCVTTETVQDVLSQPHDLDLSFEEGGHDQPSLIGLQSSIVEVDMATPIQRSSHSPQLQIPRGVSLSPHLSPTRTLKVSPSEASPRDKPPGETRTSAKKEAVFFRTTSDRVGHCKLGSWWKQALETRRASTGLLPAVEQVPSNSQEKRGSLVSGRTYSHGLISLHESSSRVDKREVKQALKEELSTCRSSSKLGSHQAEQGSYSNRRGRGQKGKRVKRA